MIEVNNLSKYFQTNNRKICALKNISFKINKNESVGIIGKNGSGKTTLLKILSGILSPSSGSIKVLGKSVSLIELGVGFHPELTGKENIFLYSSILGMPKKVVKTKMDEIIEFSELSDFIEEKLKTYSTGMKLRLAFSVGIYHNPDIFFIDETLAVGDIGFQKKCIQKIKELKKEKKMFIFASHNFELTNKICDRAIFLNRGKIRFAGSVPEAFSLMREYLDYAKEKNRFSK